MRLISRIGTNVPVSALAALWILAAAATALAQSSSIVGTLTDQAGAVVPKGTITIAEKDTGSKQTAQPNEMGLFRILNLQPGTYSLHVSVGGFKALEIANIILSSAEIRDVGKLQLEIGTVNDTVTVSAEATPVQTASSERGALIDGNQLNDVALKGRDTFGYMRLIPGIVDTSTDRSLAGPGSAGNIFINGASSSAKNVTFDGVTELDQGGNNSVFVNPSVDAVAEVKVLANAFQAEFGRNSGGTISLVTKNGTQEFHGSAFWNHRNEGLNANSFFNNRSGIQKPIYRYFVGGGTIGGRSTFQASSIEARASYSSSGRRNLRRWRNPPGPRPPICPPTRSGKETFPTRATRPER